MDSEREAALLDELAWVRRLARRLVGDAADDLTQEVAIIALRAGRDGTGLRAWLRGVVRNCAARWHRDAKRRGSIEVPIDPASDEDDPARVVELLQRQREVVEAVLALPEPYRSVVVQRFFDERSLASIARRKGMPDATVRQQLKRALAMLRARFEARHGRDWRAGLGALVTVGGARVGATLGMLTMGKKVLGAAVAVAVLSLAVGLVQSRGSPPATTPVVESAARTAAVDAGGRDARGITREPVVTPTTPTVAAIELHVATESERVLADAELVVGGDDGVTRARTDAHGEASLPGMDGSGHVLVLAPARPPRLFELPELRGQHTLTVPDGVRIAGHVELLGDPAQVPFLPELELVPSAFDTARLPSMFEEHVDAEKLKTLRVRPASAGNFAFEGLPADWSGSIGVGHAPFWLNREPIEEPRRSVKINAPKQDLRLFITPLPGVFGRVVWDDGTAVANPLVNVTVSRPDGDTLFGAQSGIDGRFVASMNPNWSARETARIAPELREVRISASHPAALRQEQFSIAADALGPGRDAGDLVLQRAARIHILVVDRAGSPIEGALVQSTSAQRTNERGRAIIAAEPSAIATRRIGAPGTRVDDYDAVAGVGTEADPLRFVVEPSNALTVRVTAAQMPLDALKLEVQSHALVFTATTAERWMPSGFHAAAGATECRSAGHSPGPPRTWTYDLALDASGTVRLVSMRPGVAIRVRVLDGLNTVAAEARLSTPAAEHHATLELTVSDAVTRFHGQVRLEGHPLAGATLMLDETSQHTRTAADGTYQLLALASGRTTSLQVSHSTAAAGTRRDVVLTAGQQELDFDLVAGHALTIFVRGPDDTPVNAAVELLDRLTGDRVDLRELGVDRERVTVGHEHLDHLRAGSFRLRGTIAGRPFERDVRVPSEEPVVLRIPELPHRTLLDGPATDLDHFTLQITDAAGRAFAASMSRRSTDGEWWHRELWLFPGTYEVVATSDGMAPATVRWTIPAPDGRVSVPAPTRR